MSNIKIVLQLMSLSLGLISSEKFCDKNRRLLLGGVFGYERHIFAYSWKENAIDGKQVWLVWHFEATPNGLVSFGDSRPVGDVFSNIPLFKSGFGLTMKCQNYDIHCMSYRELVFVFFTSKYRVFRFKDNKFSPISDPKSIPWGLSPTGDVTDWAFGLSNFDVNAIAFVGGHQSTIFITTGSVMYSSLVDTKAQGLKWVKVIQNTQFSKLFGGFVVKNELLFNDGSNNVILRYDRIGRQRGQVWEMYGKYIYFNMSSQTKVWEYFKCGKTGAAEDRMSYKSGTVEDDKIRNITTIVVISLVLIIAFTDIIVTFFWIIVYKNNFNDS